ncbi:hypothetical protein C8J56DRAFT_1113557 [Mycena floridula]|nr:hypothetical protein C8J56DRAFT_1113557 [Mycena floridula]
MPAPLAESSLTPAETFIKSFNDLIECPMPANFNDDELTKITLFPGDMIGDYTITFFEGGEINLDPMASATQAVIRRGLFVNPSSPILKNTACTINHAVGVYLDQHPNTTIKPMLEKCITRANRVHSEIILNGDGRLVFGVNPRDLYEAGRAIRKIRLVPLELQLLPMVLHKTFPQFIIEVLDELHQNGFNAFVSKEHFRLAMENWIVLLRHLNGSTGVLGDFWRLCDEFGLSDNLIQKSDVPVGIENEGEVFSENQGEAFILEEGPPDYSAKPLPKIPVRPSQSWF